MLKGCSEFQQDKKTPLKHEIDAFKHFPGTASRLDCKSAAALLKQRVNVVMSDKRRALWLAEGRPHPGGGGWGGHRGPCHDPAAPVTQQGWGLSSTSRGGRRNRSPNVRVSKAGVLKEGVIWGLNHSNTHQYLLLKHFFFNWDWDLEKIPHGKVGFDLL